MRKVLSVGLLLISIISTTTLAGCSEEDEIRVDKIDEKVDERLSLISSLLEESDVVVDESIGALLENDYDLARQKALKAINNLNTVLEILKEIEGSLPAEEREYILTFVEYERRWATLAYKTTNLRELYHSLSDRILSDEAYLVIPEIELLERGYRENAEDWRELAQFLRDEEEFRERAKITAQNVEIIFGLADSTFELADTLREYAELLKSNVEDYRPVENREFAGDAKAGKLIGPETANFFNEFDADGNRKLSIGEAQEFFFWVEENIEYRYDDEEVANPIIGFKVGDGREGRDYRQTPEETLSERAGDCEDMATLEVSFYKYFGIPAYVVGLDTKKPNLVDHAAAIVWIGEHKDDFEAMLGGLLYYEIAEGVKDIYGNPIRPGVYMIVDNSYSGALGYISGGTDRNTFTIHCIIPLERGYGDEWPGIVERCVVRMD